MVFQLENENIFRIIQGVYIIENDMVAAMELYDETVRQVMGTERIQNIKSDKQQFLFKLTAVKCIGHEGVKQ